MKLIKRRFEELGTVKYTIHTIPLGAKMDGDHILVVGFEGDFGVGCSGNDNGDYMAMIVKSACMSWPARGVILDFRKLNYVWGDMLDASIFAPYHPTKIFVDEVSRLAAEKKGAKYSQKKFPTAILVSDKCREGVSSLLGEKPTVPLFDSLDEAFRSIKPDAEAWECL